MDKNRLILLTPALGSCTAMSELILTENLIPELPSSVGNLAVLTNLNMDKNQLKVKGFGWGWVQALTSFFDVSSKLRLTSKANVRSALSRRLSNQSVRKIKLNWRFSTCGPIILMFRICHLASSITGSLR